MRRPRLNGLRAFQASAHRLNFRLAAEDLNVTQGAIAQQVRLLESEVGRPLFRRHARGLALTEAGAAYAAAVNQGLGIIDAATDALRQTRRRLRLSVTPSFAAKWLAPRIAGLAEALPEVDIDVAATDALAELGSDGVDLAIRQTAPPFESGLHARLLAPLDLCVVGAPEYGERLPEAPEMNDLAVVPLIEDSHAMWRSLLGKAFSQSIDGALRFNQTALAIDAAIAGRGLAIAPALLVRRDVEDGRLAVFWRDRDERRSAYYIVRRAENGKNATLLTDATAWLEAEVAAMTK